MQQNSNVANWSIMILLAFIWGSSFILMKKGLHIFSYTQVADLRMSLAWLSLLPLVWSQLKKTPAHFWIPLAVVGLFGNGIPAFLFTKAQTQLDSSLTGILNALVPLFTLLIAVFVFKTKVKWYNILGILIGLTGAIWLVAGDGVVMENAHYAWFVVVATICYAISLNTIKNYLGELNPIHITGLAFFFVGPPTLIHLFSTDFLEIMNTQEKAWSALGYIFILAVIGTSMAVAIFNKLVARTTAIFASSVTYLIPIFAIMWGVIDGEQIALQHILGTAIIFAGIYLVNKQ
tara:strand:+ start:6107 stop:6976 length:870 start_codon:yes stop_codon:yes gene_type:complete